jgi:hypothetical protein
MSAAAMMRHAMRDVNNRQHSLFAFSPERVLGLKRSAEVSVAPSLIHTKRIPNDPRCFIRHAKHV